MADVAISRTGDAFVGENSAPARWSLPHRIFFRFLCSYLILYCPPNFYFGDYPGQEIALQAYTKLMHAICPWVAIHIFHLSGSATTYHPTGGSADTTLAYIQNLLLVAFAIAATLIWSLLDRKRSDYRTLHGWLRLLVRYTLALTLIAYGFLKVFPVQFQAPLLFKLVEPFGDFSPMAALWNFMGASPAYTMFSGAAEVTGGMLLLFRRTTTLGALVSFGVMLNVVALDFCYDVPAKLFSANVLLLAVFLAAGDLRRLVNVLVLNRPAAPAAPSAPRFEGRWLRVAVTTVWLLFVGYTLVTQIQESREEYNLTYQAKANRPPLYGLYEVEAFTRNGRELPMPVTDATLWRKVASQNFGWRLRGGGVISVQKMDNSITRYGAAFDAGNSVVTLNDRDPLAWAGSNADPEVLVGTLAWTRPDAEHLLLEGNLADGAVSIRLREIDTSRLLLFSRGFHWINETPFNR